MFKDGNYFDGLICSLKSKSHSLPCIHVISPIRFHISSLQKDGAELTQLGLEPVTPVWVCCVFPICMLRGSPWHSAARLASAWGAAQHAQPRPCWIKRQNRQHPHCPDAASPLWQCKNWCQLCSDLHADGQWLRRMFLQHDFRYHTWLSDACPVVGLQP